MLRQASVRNFTSRLGFNLADQYASYLPGKPTTCTNKKYGQKIAGHHGSFTCAFRLCSIQKSLLELWLMRDAHSRGEQQSLRGPEFMVCLYRTSERDRSPNASRDLSLTSFMTCLFFRLICESVECQ